jgi:ribosomal protein L11 methyltransferase
MIEIAIAATDELRNQLVALLGQLGVEGFWEDDDLLKCYIPERRWSLALQEEIRRTVAAIVRSSTQAVPDIRIHSLPDRNWNEEWEKTIQPLHVTRRIVISPSWHDYKPAAGEIVLTIDPKMSFGTGYHESTRLILGLLEVHIRPGGTVLDVGTGTGVLALAALRLGAASAIAVDIDEWSYANALENAQLNGVSDRLTILHGDITATPLLQHDLVVANIQRSILIPMLAALRSRMKVDGKLLLAGLLTADREPMLAALQEAGFRVCEETRENEWIALAAERMS